MGLYPGGLKRGINFALEPEWAFIRDFTVIRFFTTDEKKLFSCFATSQQSGIKESFLSVKPILSEN